MKYFLVFGAMFNKIVSAESAEEIDGKVIKELTEEEAKNYASNFGEIPNAD